MGTISEHGPSAAEITAAHIAAEKVEDVEIGEIAQQVDAARDAFTDLVDENNPLAGKFKADEEDMKKKAIARPTRAEKKADVEKILVREDAEKSAFTFEHDHPELKKEVLILLLRKAVGCKTKEELLQLIEQFYKDPSLADEALDYLLIVAQGSFKDIVQEAKTALHELYGREITAGRNIAEEVRKYSAKGLGEPTQLRSLYGDLTSTPREAATLYKELLDRYKTQNMRTVIAYLYHAIGSDLKRGPSIAPGLLHNLLAEVRSLQGGLSMQRFFTKRMDLVKFLFKNADIPIPPEITAESLSLQFVSLLEERYPSADKVLQLLSKMGLENASTLGKIYALSQFRDALNEVSPEFYRSNKHKEEVRDSILTALETLEQQYDEEIEEEYAEEDMPKEDAQQKETSQEDVQGSEVEDDEIGSEAVPQTTEKEKPAATATPEQGKPAAPIPTEKDTVPAEATAKED